MALVLKPKPNCDHFTVLTTWRWRSNEGLVWWRSSKSLAGNLWVSYADDRVIFWNGICRFLSSLVCNHACSDHNHYNHLLWQLKKKMCECNNHEFSFLSFMSTFEAFYLQRRPTIRDAASTGKTKQKKMTSAEEYVCGGCEFWCKLGHLDPKFDILIPNILSRMTFRNRSLKWTWAHCNNSKSSVLEKLLSFFCSENKRMFFIINTPNVWVILRIVDQTF